MNRRRYKTTLALGWALVALVCIGGCAKVGDFLKTDMTRFFSPERMVKQPRGTPINPIFSSVGPADTSQEMVPNATVPREEDWTYTDTDYLIGPSDYVNVTVMDLFVPGQEAMIQRRVSNSGFIDFPLVDELVKAEGLTEEQLKAEVVRALRVNVLRDPQVSVSVIRQSQNVFSILGAVERPNQYVIQRKDMRLLEALALAGGVTQPHIRYIYVIRPVPAVRVKVSAPEPDETGLRGTPAQPSQRPESSELTLPEPTFPAASFDEPKLDEPKKEEAHDIDEALRELGAALPAAPETQKDEQATPSNDEKTTPSVVVRLSETSNAGPSAASQPTEVGQSSGAYRWIYTSKGEWVQVAADAPMLEESPESAEPGTEPQGDTPQDPDPFGWKKLDKSEMARIIAIKLDKLDAGDPRMNIIVRRNDIIRVPPLEFGDVYVTGEVLRPGPVSVAGRRMTIKMLMSMAGNLGPFAWPENSLLIRRVGDAQEQYIPLNIEAIFHGDEPDIFLKPDDVVAVGTDVRSMFYAVMRNAFRMTYGFGFLYDRNFSTPQLITPTSRRFTRL